MSRQLKVGCYSVSALGCLGLAVSWLIGYLNLPRGVAQGSGPGFCGASLGEWFTLAISIVGVCGFSGKAWLEYGKRIIDPKNLRRALDPAEAAQVDAVAPSYNVGEMDRYARFYEASASPAEKSWIRKAAWEHNKSLFVDKFGVDEPSTPVPDPVAPVKGGGQ